MSHLRWTIACAGFVLLPFADAAFAGQFTDPSGFSFTYPDDWFAIDRATKDKAVGSIPQEMKDWIAKNNVDMSKTSVVLVRNGRSAFLENLNVVVHSQAMPMTSKSVTEVKDTIPKQFSSMGIQVDKFTANLQNVGPNKAIVVDMNTRLPGVPFPLRQRQVYIAGSSNTYIITCTSQADTFDQYAPIFDSILASFRFPGSGNSSSNSTGIQKSAYVGVIIGVVAVLAFVLIGVAVLVVVLVMKKSPKKRRVRR